MRTSRHPNGQLQFPLIHQYVDADITAPPAYSGVLAFHKYWGKKPYEPISYLIERLTELDDVILDPFMGSGVSGFAAHHLGRRFIGIDINPMAHRLASLMVNPPLKRELTYALAALTESAKPVIDETYRTVSSTLPASHVLWDENIIKEVWANDGRKRRTSIPAPSDYQQADKYEGHVPSFRSPTFFKNSRINTCPEFGWKDFFTGRALHNIEILLQNFKAFSPETQRGLELCLTASLGQMSKMVFAITARGKTTGSTKKHTEVGSWVIGFWRPKVHFEINVWNCFSQKGYKLLKSLTDTQNKPSIGSLDSFIERSSDICLINDDVLKAISDVPDSSVRLIITDPPHGDRVPYLELSELWNSVLGYTSDFSREIVVSDARQREMTDSEYTFRMMTFANLAAKKLHPKGFLAIMFNAASPVGWDFFRPMGRDGSQLIFRGCFPLNYSARSVVQDNREGALKNDFVLLFSFDSNVRADLESIPGWSNQFPMHSMREDAVNV